MTSNLPSISKAPQIQLHMTSQTSSLYITSIAITLVQVTWIISHPGHCNSLPTLSPYFNPHYVPSSIYLFLAQQYRLLQSNRKVTDLLTLWNVPVLPIFFKGKVNVLWDWIPSFTFALSSPTSLPLAHFALVTWASLVFLQDFRTLPPQDFGLVVVFFLFVFCLECSPRWFTMPTSSLSSGLCPLNISFSLKSFLTIHSNLCDYPLYLLLLLSFFLSIYYHLKFYLFYLTFWLTFHYCGVNSMGAGLFVIFLCCHIPSRTVPGK